MADFDIDFDQVESNYSTWSAIKNKIGSVFNVFKRDYTAWKLPQKRLSAFFDSMPELKPENSNLERLVYAIHNPTEKNLDDFQLFENPNKKELDLTFDFLQAHGINPIEDYGSTRTYLINGGSYFFDYDKALQFKIKDDESDILQAFLDLEELENDNRVHAHQNLAEKIYQKYSSAKSLASHFNISNQRIEINDIENALLAACEWSEESKYKILNDDQLNQTFLNMLEIFESTYKNAIEFVDSDNKNNLLDLLVSSQLDSLKSRIDIYQKLKTYDTQNQPKYFCLGNVKIGTPLGSMQLEAIEGPIYFVRNGNETYSFNANEVTTRQGNNNKRKIRLKREIILSDSKDIVLYQGNQDNIDRSLRTVTLDLKTKIEQGRKFLNKVTIKKAYAAPDFEFQSAIDSLLFELMSADESKKESIVEQIELNKEAIKEINLQSFEQNLFNDSNNDKVNFWQSNQLDLLLNGYNQYISNLCNISSSRYSKQIENMFGLNKRVDFDGELNSFEIMARKNRAEFDSHDEDIEVIIE